MKTDRKQSFVITATVVMQAVKIMAILILVWEFFTGLLMEDSFDSHTIMLLIGALACLETGLQAKKG